MNQSCPVIAGPTGVGKTGLVTALADRHRIEVISLDSRQIYHGLRIGTAQPTAAEQADCPHHLVDFVSPAEKYDAARFRADFERAYQDIAARGSRPILVGGAGMYLTALQQGFMDIPGGTPARLAAVRASLETLDDREVRTRLKAVDPESFARIHANDRYRSQRALEIHLICGETMTDLQARQQPDPALGLAFPTFVLERPVGELDGRIARRTRAMLAAGWVSEVRNILAEHAPDCPGLRSIGYREIVGHLAGRLDLEAMEREIILSTRQYAKRQRTWFRPVAAAYRGAPEDPSLLASLDACLAE
jgi:tRNA dimethylallyltransferase